VKPILFLSLAAALVAPLLAAGDDGLSTRSPFLPLNAPQGGDAAASQGEHYELAGASLTNEGTLLCLYDSASKHYRWLTVGKTDDGIQVVSYDPNREEAVVRFDGSAHVLSLRQVRTQQAGGLALVSPAQPVPMTPMPSPVNNGGPIVDPSTIGKSPEVIKQEREARMLVSDLLEIGMQQRKAYEEAQKKAAAAAGQPKS
jgi:hypothetical protein